MTRQKRYYLKNKERINAKRREAYRKKCGRPLRVKLSEEELILRNRQRSRNWVKNNPGKNVAKTYKRRAAKWNRTPKWADLKAISEFYANCPEGFHVDHIIPLRGKIVSGLHVLENLQYLPALDNYKKANKFF